MSGAAPAVTNLHGVDAIGIYSKASAAPQAAPYADLVAATEAYWRTMAATLQPMVPTALTGADRRPQGREACPLGACTEAVCGRGPLLPFWSCRRDRSSCSGYGQLDCG